MQSTHPVSSPSADNVLTDANLRSIALSLQRIAAALQRQQQPKQPTGFITAKNTTVIYANLTKGNGDGWYVLQDNETKTMLPEFYGIVTGIEFPKTTRRNQEVTKFHLLMKDLDENRYVFESGIDTFFTRAVLYSLANASPDELQYQLRLYSYIPELNTGDRTLTVSVTATCTGSKLSSGWKSSDDWRQISKRARQNLRTAQS